MNKQPESALDKFLKSHRRTCTVFIFSGDRHCSCGRDAAIAELQKMRAEQMGQLSFFIPINNIVGIMLPVVEMVK